MWNIKLFINKGLLSLTTADSQVLVEIIVEPVDYWKRPVIFTEDFNINFLLPESESLINFLENKFFLRMINSKNYYSTKSDIPIDLSEILKL